MSINWKGIYHAVKEIEETSETLHDINFTTELTRFMLVVSPTGIIETGTAGGVTTAYFAHMFPNLPVFSCELFPDPVHLSKQFARYKNIIWMTLDSRRFLPLLGKEEVGPRPFVFLDAHMRDQPNPIKDEFRILIDKLKEDEFTSVAVCVHDFKVEENPSFGFNSSKYDGTDLAWETIEFIKPYAKAVWFPLGNPITKYSRGRIYVYLSASQPVMPPELSILENLGILWRFI